MCCLLDIYDGMSCLLNILEINYFTEAKLILIIYADLALLYVFVSFRADGRLEPLQPYVSRSQQPAACLVRSSRVYLVQQPYVYTSSRTSRPAAVHRLNNITRYSHLMSNCRNEVKVQRSVKNCQPFEETPDTGYLIELMALGTNIDSLKEWCTSLQT